MIKDTITTYQGKWTEQEQQREILRNKVEQKQERITRLNSQIERLEKRLSKIPYASWIDEIIEPIAKAMTEKLPGRHYDILGPFGLCARTSIH